jgi:hypothetical protein
MKKIPLTQGKEALVDDDMYEYLTCWDWHYSTGYAKRGDVNSLGKSIIVRMHHFVLPLKDGLVCDHINGNRLDNRRENLRLVTKSQNMRNQGLSKRSRSGFKGVNKHQKKWRAYICIDGKQKHLGVFLDKKQAALAYNEAAQKCWGIYARLNEI